MTASIVDPLFSDHIFPDFPFKNQNWLAVAFERNGYDNTRMPEWFFREASNVFNPSESSKLLIKGDCFALEGRGKIACVGFNWDCYSRFMRSAEGFSLEYKMANGTADFACWADPELTVIGGESSKMDEVLDRCGGRESMLGHIEREFFLDEPAGNEDMRRYFRGLLFRDGR
ncbi:MAG TPA: hypothetical protein VD865_01680 [Stenotrophomonas sp.]|nr:hypothetical protein [Stenotrophomonas sp.]